MASTLLALRDMPMAFNRRSRDFIGPLNDAPSMLGKPIFLKKVRVEGLMKRPARRLTVKTTAAQGESEELKAEKAKADVLEISTEERKRRKGRASRQLRSRWACRFFLFQSSCFWYSRSVSLRSSLTIRQVGSMQQRD